MWTVLVDRGRAARRSVGLESRYRTDTRSVHSGAPPRSSCQIPRPGRSNRASAFKGPSPPATVDLVEGDPADRFLPKRREQLWASAPRRSPFPRKQSLIARCTSTGPHQGPRVRRAAPFRWRPLGRSPMRRSICPVAATPLPQRSCIPPIRLSERVLAVHQAH